MSTPAPTAFSYASVTYGALPATLSGAAWLAFDPPYVLVRAA